jgi:hypothetical protein
MKCEVCGNEIPEGQKYCPVCGDPVQEIDVSQVEKLPSIKVRPINIGLTKFKILLTVVIGIIVALCTAISKKPEHLPRIVEKAKIQDIADKKIYFSDNYIFCNNGAVIDQFANAGRIEYAYNSDNTELVLVADGKCYYIDTAMHPRLICENAGEYVYMNSEGGYFVYEDAEEKSQNYFDVNTGMARKLPNSSVFFGGALSPDGKTVGYYTYNGFISFNTEKGIRHIASNPSLTLLGISNDGNRAFFIKYENDSNSIWHYNNGELKKIGEEKSVYHSNINYDCTGIIFFGGDHLWYFDEGMESAKALVEGYIYDIYYEKAVTPKEGRYSSVEYVDMPSLTNCLVSAEKAYYYIYDGNEAPIVLTQDDSAYGAQVYVDEDGAKLLYKKNNTFEIAKMNKEGVITEKVDTKLGKGIGSFAASDDLSTIYFEDHDNGLYLWQNGDCEKIAQLNNYYNNIEKSELEGRVYVVTEDNDLCYLEIGSKELIKLKSGCMNVDNNYISFKGFVRYCNEVKVWYTPAFGNTILLEK